MKRYFLVENLNLLSTVLSSHYGVETGPQSVCVNDFQFGASITVGY